METVFPQFPLFLHNTSRMEEVCVKNYLFPAHILLQKFHVCKFNEPADKYSPEDFHVLYTHNIVHLYSLVSVQYLRRSNLNYVLF